MEYFKTIKKENQTTLKLTKQNNDEHDENLRIQNSIENAEQIWIRICKQRT